MTPPGSLSGILLVDKPVGPTSHDVVETARSGLGERRIGHTGTLDPLATGLLVLCVGPATRLAEYFHLLPKRYRAVLRLGVETTTHDAEGEPVDEGEDASWKELDRQAVEEALSGFRGTVRQRPPAFSAKRVAGRRAHEAARAGEAVELEPVEVQVHHLALARLDLPLLEVDTTVSTGTYVRSLARDLGRALGAGAHLTSLRRTAVGPYSVADALEPEALEGGPPSRDSPAWLEPAQALCFLPHLELSPEMRRRVGHGQRVPARGMEEPTCEVDGLAAAVRREGRPVAMVRGGELVAVGEQVDGEVQPRKVFDDS